MKRDMDLIRLILLVIEENEDEKIWNLTIDGHESKQVAYHCKLLRDHGLV